MYPSKISRPRQISFIMQSTKKCILSERSSTFLTHWPPATCKQKVSISLFVFPSKKMTFFRRALALKIFSAGGVSKRGALGPPLSRKFWDFQGTKEALWRPPNNGNRPETTNITSAVSVCVCGGGWRGR